MFEPPPMEWITERLGRLQDLLERQTERSALLLRRVLGPVRLVPTRPEVGRPYYQAETALRALELLEPPEGGLNWSRQWRRGESNPVRTSRARVPVRLESIPMRLNACLDKEPIMKSVAAIAAVLMLQGTIARAQ